MSERAAVHYVLEPSDPAGHLFRVTLTVAEPDPEGQRLWLPVWIPGSYMVREFAKNIVWIGARCGERAVALTKVDKSTWRAAPCDGPLVVTWEVYAWDLSVRSAHLDQTHGFFNGTSVFLAVAGQEHAPHEVELLPPADPACAGWRVATTLPRVTGHALGFGTFRAPDYDALIDHPVELGTFDHLTFEACGVPHELAVTGRHRGDLQRVVDDLRPICEQHIRMFGEPAPFDRYLFLLTVVGDGHGGLEHRASSANIAKRSALPVPGVAERSDGYRGLLGLLSHEYFHAWNVKRIKPRAFVPYDLTREGHTTLLWAFEGITSYYDDLGLLRSGRIEVGEWLELVGQTATRVRRGLGRTVQSLSDSSFDAWTKFYRQDENAPNAIVSYYAKGSLAAMALDLELRRLTDDRRSLDDVMRALWARYGDGSGVPEDGVEELASELAGADLSAFFDAAIRGTDELPLPALLERVGVRWCTRPAHAPRDKGGKPHKDKGLAEPGDLGVDVVAAKHGAKLEHVHRGGAAHRAGLSAHDVVVAFDGLRVSGADLFDHARALPAGARVTVHAFRGDVLRAVEVTLAAPPSDTVWLELDDDAPPEVRARRDRWLRGESGGAGAAR